MPACTSSANGRRAGRARTRRHRPRLARIDTERARERGAEIGQKAAVATKKIEESLDEAALTGKIKAKMALDDTVKARAIDVTTTGLTVTLSGQVPSAAAHERAVALARETEGVTKVVDHIEVVAPR